ncbi:flagellar biosynthesis protein FliO [Agrobacterium rubi]|uniref:flagellar biosynthetic protein FliO n=1 Tax=Agrobacterium rubi TaxID=28099 RepID=UPI0015743961|nr:flagellar biosynthetic protein FliO [Agrobacterium rubi]NTF07374.1 flagellar biosynthesis protein FliO [Agrobacterium rubi]NTF19630.1 flagellar biosynthesis protein FliO [Agrobacterium rubi]NTF26593.1 flagellar biosynthesis protein FliO [Agrobacterium rubi]
MMDELIGTYGNNLIVAVVGVGVALLALAVVLWIIRRRGGSSPFIRGGKNRQPRLQVLDATAVDTRRRLVLVRRDNVEHLVMIGGPTDIVIESGIGAIPFMKDVREPQNEALEAPAREKAIASERPRALAATREEARPSMPIPPAATGPQPVSRPAPVATPVPQPTPPVAQPAPPVSARPAPVPAPAPAPRQPAPVAPPVDAAAPTQPAPRPAPPPVPSPAPEIAPAPKAIAREPVVAPLAPAVVPAVTAASLAVEPVEKPSPPAPAVQERPVTPPPVIPAPAIEPEPAFQAPVVDQNNAVDFLDAARERVLPTYRNETPITATASPAKPVPLAPDENGAVFGDQLTSDFESFLEAEIAKNNAANTPDVSLEPASEKAPAERVSPPSTGNAADDNVQKEMARIFGEMSVTRDK